MCTTEMTDALARTTMRPAPPTQNRPAAPPAQPAVDSAQTSRLPASMSTRASTSPTPPGEHDTETVALTAEALLREHPDAQVCALASNGLIVPVPRTVGLWGQGLIEGRALVDNVVAGDRTAVVRLCSPHSRTGPPPRAFACSARRRDGRRCTSSICARSTACCSA